MPKSFSYWLIMVHIWTFLIGINCSEKWYDLIIWEIWEAKIESWIQRKVIAFYNNLFLSGQTEIVKSLMDNGVKIED